MTTKRKPKRKPIPNAAMLAAWLACLDALRSAKP